jgi:hypothetical protein
MVILSKVGLKCESPSALGAGGLLESWGLAVLAWDAKVRRHARHMMMVVMTMMDADLHLEPP